MVAIARTFLLLGAAESAELGHQTCGDVKEMYKAKGCCGNPDKVIDAAVVPRPAGKMLAGENICDGAKVYLPNKACIEATVNEQSGVDLSDDADPQFNTTHSPITTSYMAQEMCAVNVHWHLGAEHRVAGEYDENGTYPSGRRLEVKPSYHRNLAGDVRYGGKCHLYNASMPEFTTEYDWQHCVDVHVGDTYEVHWPHSKAGACGTPNQFQTPFYDGVFCRFGNASQEAAGTHVNLLADLPGRVGVQGQVFTIINDEDYYYPNLMQGMIIEGEYGADMASYTGSTTGTTRNNTMCSSYTPITWQVDRKCHLISASSFDKMCADMKQQRDDMSNDLHPHGAREVVLPQFAANNVESLR